MILHYRKNVLIAYHKNTAKIMYKVEKFEKEHCNEDDIIDDLCDPVLFLLILTLTLIVI